MKKFYKCLAKDCDRQLEKKYLFCSIECACYSGFSSGCRMPHPIIEFFRNIRRRIIYRFHMLLRSYE
jgi:hypothetical protein